MEETSFKTELLELIADVRERLSLASDLGINGFETDFVAAPEVTLEKDRFAVQAKKPAPFAPQQALTETILASNENRPTPATKPVISPAAPTRFASLREKLEATKLSKISPSLVFEAKTEADVASIEQSSTPNIATNLSNQDFARPETIKNIGEKKMEGTSLFGDLTPEKETLPPSNETFEDVRADIGDCVRCPLYQGRTNIVHTDGNRQAKVLFVGEAPGADEDASGKPFVGRAGQLLTKIIEAIGLKREEVLIGNVNRCRPPQNRTPTIQEARTCRQFLMREIAIARPEIIVVMGNTATQNLLDTKEGITKLRGKFQDYYGIKVMPTFHPAYLLRDPTKKRETWEDMKIVRDELAKTKS